MTRFWTIAYQLDDLYVAQHARRQASNHLTIEAFDALPEEIAVAAEIVQLSREAAQIQLSLATK